MAVADLKLTFGYTGGTHDAEISMDVDPTPPATVSIELYLIDNTGAPAWINVSGPFTHTGWSHLIEGASNTVGVEITRTCTQQDQYLRYSGGRLTFTLKNMNGEWDPLNLTGPWVVSGKTLLKQGSAGTPVRVRVTSPGGDLVSTLFTGFVSSWPVSYIGKLYSDVQIVAQDGVAQLSATSLAPLNIPTHAGQSAGQRIQTALVWGNWANTIGRAGPDNIDTTAIATMQATAFKSDVWTESILAAESDGGYVWMNPLNGVQYRNRYYLIGASPTVTFSMNSETGTFEYQPGLVNSSDLSQTGNVVKQTRDGGLMQTATADTAQAEGYAAWDRDGLLMEQDVQACDLAIHQAGLFRHQLFRPTQIPVQLTPLDGAWTDMLGLDMFDTITVEQVTPSPPGITARTLTANVVVSGLTWKLQPATANNTLTITTTVAPVVLTAAKVGTAKVDVDVVQYSGVTS